MTSLRRSPASASRIAVAAVGAITLIVGSFWLGSYVGAHGEPPVLWAFAQSVRGHALGLAWALTSAVFPFVLAPLFLLCIAFGVANRAWRWRAIGSVVAALLAWRIGDAMQHLFHRPRRGDWLIQHVHAFSYPSTHASISASFYFLWGVLLLRSALPAPFRYAACAALTALTVGILWSRLALAAHYPTDLIGGLALGLGIDLLFAVLLLARAGKAESEESAVTMARQP